MSDRNMKRTLALASVSSLALSLSACSSLGNAVGVASTGVAKTGGSYAGVEHTQMVSMQPAARPGVATLLGPGELAHSSLPPWLQAIDPRMAYRPSFARPVPRSQHYLDPAAYQYPASSGQLSVLDGECPPSGQYGCPPQAACPPYVYPTAPRVELPVIQGVEHPATNSELYPDEYLCDGGDQGRPTSVGKDGTIVLQFEETVGTFLDDDAARHVEPSTRVCVYAPSFGAVRTISQPILDHTYDSVSGVKDQLAAVGYEAPIALLGSEKIDTGMQTRVRARASEVDVDRGDALVANVLNAENHSKMLNVFQEYNFLGDKQLTAETIAIIKEGLTAAVAWDRSQGTAIYAKDDKLNVVSARAVSQEYFDYEDKRPEGELRVIKTASAAAAKPGDVIDFAIRFDNLGGRPVFDVNIVDHLSPRLELVEGSVNVDLEADVLTEDDFKGSVYLKVRLKEPLDEKTGGVVTFQCRVRP